MVFDTALTAPGNYPVLTVQQNDAPNKFWAIPILGIVAKGFAVIPVGVWLYVLTLAVMVMLVINSFSVLFSGTYMEATRNLVRGWLRLETRVALFVYGITDRYPGFSLEPLPSDTFTLDMPDPISPSRGFAIPMLGGLARGVMIIPLGIWAQVVGSGAFVGMIVASFSVLLAGRYPESVYEIGRDAMRLGLASSAYFAGLSDSYPSFSISMNHPGTKWAMIGFGIVLTLLNVAQNAAQSSQQARGG